VGAERIYIGVFDDCADVPWFFSSFQESDDSDDSGEEEEEVDEELSKWKFLSSLPLLVPLLFQYFWPMYRKVLNYWKG
jgi:hypothetical protein